uniref:ATP synthase subunit a n=1 Tax=Tachaea chinensis TaxID=1862870 RepID=A0A7L4XQW2_9CRUS|nr:ATP synthase F0 subunit 6 [Tachaea chinensis]
MTNLFSIFDPSSSILNLPINWMSVSLGLMIFPSFFWQNHSRLTMLFSLMFKSLLSEIFTILKKNSPNSMIILSLFSFILFNNFLGLLPFIFTASSHMMFSLSLALSLWLSIFFVNIFKKTNLFLSHLIPLGTPPLLMPFMVLVETLSALIRPLTLSIRLTANMIAGHILLSLMSSSVNILFPLMSLTIILSQIMLMILEMAVSIIQSYVFMILMTLYLGEL